MLGCLFLKSKMRKILLQRTLGQAAIMCVNAALLWGGSAVLLGSTVVQAHIIDELMGNMVTAQINPSEHKLQQPKIDVSYPGRTIGAVPAYAGESAFTYNWPYRAQTYELVFAQSAELAASIYSLAISAGDISKDVSRERFLRGVSGFHYSLQQVLDFVNGADFSQLHPEEHALISWLQDDGVIARNAEGQYQAGTSGIKHILGAAPGKKRSYELNLKHERLHVYWDQDEALQRTWQERYSALSANEKSAVHKKLKQYNQDNEPQLIEEWAVGELEHQALPATI